MTLGVSVTMLPTRSCPRQFAVGGDAEVASEMRPADDPPGDGADAGGVPAVGMAGTIGAADGGAPPADGPGVSDFSASGAGGEPGVGAAEGGDVPPGGGATGEDGLGAPAGGGDDPGGGAPESGSMRPKRAAVRRILKKYMATIASANAINTTIVMR